MMNRTSIVTCKSCSAQLFQQVDDFLVDFLGLADDQAEVRFETGDRARPAHVIPAWWA